MNAPVRRRMLEMLGYISFGLGIILLGVNFLIGRLDSREKKRESDALRSALEDIKAQQARGFDDLRATLKELVAQGRVSSEDARRIVQIFLREQVQFSEELKTDIKRAPESRPQ